MKFPEKFLTLRLNSGYSQETLAEKLGTSRQAISKWELGINLPDTEKIITISEFFDVSIDYLLKEETRISTDESLDRLVLRFLGSAQDMSTISEELVDIMRDGIITEEEKVRLYSIMDILDNISNIIDEIKIKMNI